MSELCGNELIDGPCTIEAGHEGRCGYKQVWNNGTFTIFPGIIGPLPKPAPTSAEVNVTRKLDELKCDLCGRHLCWAYEFDLNGSYFYCGACVAERNNR